MIQIDIANKQRLLKLDRRQLRAAARSVLTAHGVDSAEISIAIVDDPAIHELNCRWLQHDYPTDVISFVLEERPGHLEGEIVASAETASQVASQLGAAPHDELVLYVVHGMLHLVGFDDQTPAAAQEMRDRECEIMNQLGLPITDRDASPPADSGRMPRVRG